MAVIATVKTYRVSIKTNTGSTAEGAVITKSISLGSLRSNADQEKVMAVVDLLEPILAEPIYSVEETTVKVLSE